MSRVKPELFIGVLAQNLENMEINVYKKILKHVCEIFLEIKIKLYVNQVVFINMI